MTQPSSLFAQLYDWRRLYAVQVLVSLVSATVIAIFTFISQRDLQLAEQAQQMAGYEAAAQRIAPMVSAYDYDGVVIYARALETLRPVVAVKVQEIRGLMVYGAEEPVTGPFTHISFPLTADDGGVSYSVGTLTLHVIEGYPNVPLFSALTVMLIAFLTVFFTSVLASGGYVARSIIGPLEKLSRAIDATARHGAPVKAVIRSRDYFGRLASQFNFMQQRLLDTQDDLGERSAELEQQTLVLQRVLASTDQSVRHFDEAGRVTDYDISPAANRVLCLLPRKPVATADDLWSSLAGNGDLTRIQRADEPETPEAVRYTLSIAASGGSSFEIRLVTLAASGSAYLVTDVTTERDLMETLLRAQSIETLGVLAGGIAHDFNNVLVGILGNLEMIEGLVRDDPAVRYRVQVALGVSLRAKALTTSLLSFSQRQSEDRALIQVSDIIKEATAIVRDTLGRRYSITVEGVACATLHVATANVVAAVMNLIINARDAMPAGGAIRLGARLLDAADAGVKGAGGAQRYVELYVTDCGAGVADAVKDKILKEFFTTKAGGSSTGLGLPMANRTAQREGGRLKFWNNPDGGASFALILPCV